MNFIIPVLTYSSEIWTLRKQDANLPLTFECKELKYTILTRVYEKEACRKRYNFGLYNPYQRVGGWDIVNATETTAHQFQRCHTVQQTR